MEKLIFKNNFLGYIKFYYQILGMRLVFYVLINILVGLLDGLGLAMFIPLLQVATGDVTSDSTKASMGGLHYITDFIKMLGFKLNLTSILIFLVLLFVLKGLCRYGQSLYASKIRMIFIQKIRFGLVDLLKGLSYHGFLKIDAGKIQNSLIAEVQRVFNTFNSYFISIQAFIMLLTYVLMAFSVNFKFAIFVAIGGSLSSFIYKIINSRTKKESKKISLKGHDFNAYLIQIIQNFKYLKATNYIEKYSKKIYKIITDTEILNYNVGKLGAMSDALREPVVVIIVSVVIFIQVNWMHGSLSSIILSLLLFYRSLLYLMNVQQNWQNFLANVGAMDVVTEIWNDFVDMKEEMGSVELNEQLNNIELKSLNFFYGQHKVIDNINISIPKNKTIAFVGESGSGKTTLTNIITAILERDRGTMLINNQDSNEINLKSYRNRIGYISQEPVIFNDTIFNNVSFWDEPSTENLNKFWKVMRLAHLEDVIKSFAEAENTTLGDNGILISGGQKQRISIARELYKDINLLIFDEATSALDSETEFIIKNNIDSLQGEYTMIIIAHRLSTIKKADVIYLMEKGKIIHQGNFEDLIQKSEKFKRMVELQEI